MWEGLEETFPCVRKPNTRGMRRKVPDRARPAVYRSNNRKVKILWEKNFA